MIFLNAPFLFSWENEHDFVKAPFLFLPAMFNVVFFLNL